MDYFVWKKSQHSSLPQTKGERKEGEQSGSGSLSKPRERLRPPVVEPTVTWLTHSEAKQTRTLELGAEKGLLQEPSKEDSWFVLRGPKLPDGFQARVLKTVLEERVVGCGVSSWAAFCLICGEVTR